MKSIFLERTDVPKNSAESRRKTSAKPTMVRHQSLVLLLFALCCTVSASATTVNSNCITPNPLVFTTVASTPLLTLNDVDQSGSTCDDLDFGLHNLNSSSLNFQETVTATGASGTTYKFTFTSYADTVNQLRSQYTVEIVGLVGSGSDFVRLGIDPNGFGIANTPIDIQITLPPSSSPTITSVSPNSGSTSGGASAVITGTNFVGASAVHFGTSSASFTVNSNTQITATSPSRAVGTVDVTVTTASGTNATSSADQFTYVAAVTVGAVSATVAYGSSANAITLNFTGGTPTSVAVATAASHGTATASGTSITYTPTTGYFGSDSFTYTATNAAGTSSPATVTITVSAPTITVTPTTLTAGTAGTAYSRSLTASGGHAPYTFSTTLASGALPSGLSLSSAGAITGTPTASGTFTFTVTGTDSSTTTHATFTSATISLTIAAPTIAVAPTTLTSATAATTYSQTVTASGGGSPYTYSISSGALPAGLTLSSTGTLSGTPTAAGSFLFTVRATDANSFSGTRAYNFTVAAPAIAISPTTLPAAVSGTAYNQTVTASGGTAPYTYAVLSGSLPPGLTLNANLGVLGGTPTTTGTYSFTVRATDSTTGAGAPFNATRAYTLASGVSPPTAGAVNGTIPYDSVAFPVQLVLGGGAATSVALASPPLHGTAVASGTTITYTPATGYFGFDTFTYTASNAGGTSAPATVTGYVSPPVISVTPATLAAGSQGIAYSQTLTASGGQPPYTFSTTLASGALPTGLALNSAGLVTGTPTANGTFNFTVTGTDSSIDTHATFTSATIFLTINAVVPGAPTIGVATGGDAQAIVTFTPPASNGGSAITGYTVTSTPGGITGTGSASPITVTGLTNGTPYTFKVTATNSVGTGAASAATNSVTPIALPVSGAANVTVAYDSVANPVALSLSGGLAASVTIASSPSHGTAIATGTAITYTPATGFFGSDSFTYTGTNSSGTSAAGTVFITVSAPTISVTPTTLPTGAIHAAYSQSLTASGGASPYLFSTTLASGSLPAGLSLSSAGVISGTPTAAGTFSFTVTGTDSSTATHATFTSGAITLTISPPSLSIAPVTGTALSGTAQTPFSQSFAATGGSGTFSYALAVSSGTLPAGLTFSTSAGTLSGTPTAAGTFSFTITATDTISTGTGSPFTVAATYTLTIAAPAISLTPATLPNIVVGTGATYSQSLAATGGTAPYTFSLTAGALPPGLTLSPGGLISGIATAGGTYSFTITATDSTTGTGPFSGSATYTVASTLSPPVTTSDIATTPANQAVTVSVTANDTGAIASLAVASAPLHGTATISGLTIVYTPRHDFYGADSFRYTATGPGGTSSAATVSVTVTPLPTPASPPQTATAISSTSMTMHPTATATRGPFVSITILTQPTSGTAVVKGLDIIYLPDRSITTTTTVTFSYTITNAFGTSSPVIVTVTVKPSTQKVSCLDPSLPPANASPFTEDGLAPGVFANSKGRVA